jgi:hypothetical protein
LVQQISRSARSSVLLVLMFVIASGEELEVATRCPSDSSTASTKFEKFI